MISPVSAIEAITRTVALDIYHNAVDSDDGSHSMDMPVAIALITDAITPLARQAEALQRENAELREALKPFADVVERAETAAEYFGACHVEEVDDSRPYGLTGTTWGDLRRARALLGGENAE